ncbi:hypothetical protein RUM43_005925 [Polyplax serrata]|uniref:G-protein coupled receptors family 2 profile 2 domain-containing protein n=1 Tax=Polyplax serrata TaxID=468196 RepID=A0AAN8PXX8_POLSC
MTARGFVARFYCFAALFLLLFSGLVNGKWVSLRRKRCPGGGNAIPDRDLDLSLGEVDPEFVFAGGSVDRATVPKCCDLGEGYENKSTCVETEDEFLPDFEDRPNYSDIVRDLPAKSRYEYYIGDPCTEGKYILDTTTYSDDKYTIFSNGTLLYLDDIYTKEEFCVESVNSTIRVFVCFEAGRSTTEKSFKFILYAVGLLISVPFLLATGIIYLSVDLLRDLRGKSLSCHVICLATGYIFLALVQLASDNLNEEVCIAAGFIIQFSFVAAFFWLNVICFDTWRSIKNDFCSVHKPVNTKSEKLTFCYYFVYAFYGPVILSIVSLIMDFEPAIPESYLKPHFGFQSCWFYSDEAALPYFFAPVGITICINFIFFILSLRIIYVEQKKRAKNSPRSKDADGGAQEESFSNKVYIKM